MVQFKNNVVAGMPVYVDLEVSQQLTDEELVNALKQADQPNFYWAEGAKTKTNSFVRFYFQLFFTTSTKKPFVWEHYDSFNSIKQTEVTEFFQHAKHNLESGQKQCDWSGIKCVCFSFDSLNMMEGVKLHKEFMFEIVKPKVKNYINGSKANQDFLAKKGKMFSTKAGV